MSLSLKPIMNLHEQITHTRLKKVCSSWGASVHEKIRMADVLRIENSGIKSSEYSFALKAHFDFTVTDSNTCPLFVVEFDGPLHKRNPEQSRRDKTKNLLCKKFGLPILRINSNYFKKYRKMDILTWFINIFFLEKGFYQSQDQGLIPPDEPFDPHAILYLSDRGDNYPFWLSLEARVKIEHLRKEGRCVDHAPSVFIGLKEDIYRGIGFLRLDTERGIRAQTAMKFQDFPTKIHLILEDLVVLELYESLLACLNGRMSPEQLTDIENKVRAFLDTNSLVSAGNSGGGMFPESEPWQSYYRYDEL